MATSQHCVNRRDLEHLSSVFSSQPYRTAYHFQPPKNWMNDPCGLMKYEGVYHLFYQYNPEAATWGNIAWGHSVSYDLVNWIPLDPAIYPSQPSDIKGCWTGSASILPGGKPVIIYTGGDYQNHQVQNLAYPKNESDPFLKEWIKSPKNPIIESYKLDPSNFRDPTTAWLGKDGFWRLLIGSQNQSKGMVLLYKSKDFEKWVKAENPLFFADDTGMWECPDFFPVSREKHVLKFSWTARGEDYYMIGSYEDGDNKDMFIPDSESRLRFDYGKFYASKSFYDDEKKRRILFGWVDESSTQADNIKKGWSGIQGIPRSIWLHKLGKQLVQWPVEELEQLRSNPINWSLKVLKARELLQVDGVTASQADVEISFEVKELEKAEVLDEWVDPQILCTEKGANVTGGLGPFGLFVLASNDLQEHTAIFFRIFKYQSKNVVLLCCDQSRSSLNKDNLMTSYGVFVDVDPIKEKLSLRSLIDHSVVESFEGEGRACITARVYPTLAINDKTQLPVTSGLGPFGPFVFASKDLQEYTTLLFRAFKYQSQNLVTKAGFGFCLYSLCPLPL